MKTAHGDRQIRELPRGVRTSILFWNLWAGVLLAFGIVLVVASIACPVAATALEGSDYKSLRWVLTIAAAVSGAIASKVDPVGQSNRIREAWFRLRIAADRYQFQDIEAAQLFEEYAAASKQVRFYDGTRYADDSQAGEKSKQPAIRDPGSTGR